MTEIQHRQVELSTGIGMHVAEAGEGPAVVFCHGFPELWYSWRHQLPAIAQAGFRAIAPDMRGYGGTDAPEEIEAYAQERICADMAALLDAIGEERAVFVGHDWGGAVVWNMALHHAERVRGVAGVNTPYGPRPPINPLDAMRANPGRFDYQLYFQEPGVAEAELDADVRRTFTLLLRSSKPEDRLDALAACFPAGTVSGAPKVRAMQIIDELEPTARGPYAGAVGYLGWGGRQMDTAIAIRTMVVRNGEARVQAGAGIVADSDPEAEHQETLNKARALLRAAEMASP